MPLVSRRVGRCNEQRKSGRPPGPQGRGGVPGTPDCTQDQKREHGVLRKMRELSHQKMHQLKLFTGRIRINPQDQGFNNARSLRRRTYVCRHDKDQPHPKGDRQPKFEHVHFLIVLPSRHFENSKCWVICAIRLSSEYASAFPATDSRRKEPSVSSRWPFEYRSGRRPVTSVPALSWQAWTFSKRPSHS